MSTGNPLFDLTVGTNFRMTTTTGETCDAQVILQDLVHPDNVISSIEHCLLVNNNDRIQGTAAVGSVMGKQALMVAMNYELARKFAAVVWTRSKFTRQSVPVTRGMDRSWNDSGDYTAKYK